MKRKRKRNRNYVEASPELMALMERNHSKVVDEVVDEEPFSYPMPPPDFDPYLPEECWEIIFKLITKNKDFESVSLVSKQFLSITNRLPISFTFPQPCLPFILFQRFTNVSSLNLFFSLGMDIRLPRISRFPLTIKSLCLSQQHKFPARGFRAFSRNVTGLTSLECSNTCYFDYNHQFFLIAHCFPLLQKLDLSNTRSTTVCPNLRLQRKLEAFELNLSFGFPESDLLNFSFQFPKLEVLNLSFTSVDDEQLYIVSKACPALLKLVLEGCPCVTDKGVEHVLENCTQLTEIDIGRCFVNPTVVVSMLFSRPSLTRVTTPLGCTLSEADKKLFQLRGCTVC